MKKFIWENRYEVINRKFILDNYNYFWKYLIFLEIENYNNKKYLKYKIKFTEEYIVEMKIINKTFSKGTIMRIGGAILPSVLPNTYTIELEYEGSNYEINDKEIFNSYEIGQFINLKLVKNLDKDKNIIKSDLFKIS